MSSTNPSTQPQQIDSAAIERFDGFLTEAGSYERHFNEVQSRYRSLASTWLLAAFAGVGFVLSQKSLSLHVDRSLLASGLAFAGAAGIVLLLNLDLLVYHRLLDAVFIEALRLEREQPGLPRVRTRMLEMHGGRGVLPRVVWFYLGATDALLLLAGIAFEVWLGKHSFLAAILVGLLYVVVAALANRYLYRSACALQPGGT